MQPPVLKPVFGLILLFVAITCAAQDMKKYAGHWEAPLPNDSVFTVRTGIQLIDDSTARLTLNSAPPIPFHFKTGEPFAVAVDSHTIFKGKYTKQDTTIRAFIQSGIWQYHLDLQAAGKNRFAGDWHVLLADHFHSRFYISIEEAEGEQYAAYAFSSEPRFPGFACYGFEKKADSLHFRDFRSGLSFSGKLLPEAISLNIKIAGISIAKIVLQPSAKDWQLGGGPFPQINTYSPPPDMDDGIGVGRLRDAGFNADIIKRMVDSINANSITNTQSVLIAHKGQLVFEQYFGGFDAAAVHDMRSASKSISSAITGIAMDKGILHDTGQHVFDLLPLRYRYAQANDPRKALINIADLLTMSSGLDAVDFGITRKSSASEDAYQSTPDWLKTVVEAPMINQPGSHANYGSANPFLLGVILNARLQQPLEWFMDDYLFAPLGISNYLLQNDCFNQPYFGGGMYLRPRDMLKFGLLYAQRGRWKGQQLISSQWITASFKKYRVLENHPEKNEYGYWWWHYTYHAAHKAIHSIEARGAGGQYIFIIPDDALVIVVTSANFRNGRVWQPEKIVEDYILPAFL